MTRRRKVILGCLLPSLTVFLVLVIVPLISLWQGPHRKLGDHTISILRGADHVETFRLDDTGEGDWMGSKEIRQFPPTGRGRTQSRAFANRLSRLVLDPRTYAGPDDSTCLFNPGVAYRAWRGRECVEVIVCFHCTEMVITTKDEQGHPTHAAHTQFAFTRAAFVALAKETFPSDKEIQSLQ
jgi:hypothetical protein